MSDRVAVFTDGLWRQRREIAAMTRLVPVRRRWSARGCAAVVGWGRRPTAVRARAAARAAGAPFVALEDGFLRSVDPGAGEATLSYVLDRTGIYYDAARPSDLEMLTRRRAARPEAAARAAAPALRALRELGLSKYNRFEAGALEGLAPDASRDVLVVDQTAGDASVAGAGADAGTFRAMLVAACAEVPEGGRVILKLHPETRMGRRAGHLQAALEAASGEPAVAALREAGRIVTLAAPARPRDLLAGVARVHAVSSLLGFEALVAGRPVVCHGAAFYAGWGLTEDRCGPLPRRGPAPLEALVAAAFVDYGRWVDPETRAEIPLAAAVERLAARVAAATEAGDDG